MSAGKTPRSLHSRLPCQGVKEQQGFTLVGMLVLVALMGVGLAGYGELASHAAQREKEAELLFRGDQYRQAIAAYFKKEQTYPRELALLLQDKRYPMPVRHLRKLYPDPITGKAEWGIVEAPGGGIMGVFSTAQDEPIKSGGFRPANNAFADAKHYSDWKFFHRP